MKKWTWQWFIVLAILGMLFSCGAWIDRQPYDIDEDVYKPDRPWKQMIWKARVEIGDCRFEIADCRCGICKERAESSQNYKFLYEAQRAGRVLTDGLDLKRRLSVLRLQHSNIF